jgi:hypothetical protein
MKPLGSGNLGWFGARHDQARRSLAVVLVAFLCLALAPSVEAPAQTAPWDIETIQQRLGDLGYGVGEADGLLGPRTRAALRAFQADRGLPVTGVPDGTTQRALFAAEPPDAAAEAATPNDNPPDLDAVPLGPVRVEPLAPLVEVSPHEGPATELAPGEELAETSPPLRKDRDWTLSQGYAADKSKLRDSWIKWAAAGLAGLGALVLLAAVGHKSTKRKTVVAEQPRPIPAALPSAMTPSTMTILRNGHVFGVDVPPSRDSGPG